MPRQISAVPEYLTATCINRFDVVTILVAPLTVRKALKESKALNYLYKLLDNHQSSTALEDYTPDIVPEGMSYTSIRVSQLNTPVPSARSWFTVLIP
jgi:hypothetical protein